MPRSLCARNKKEEVLSSPRFSKLHVMRVNVLSSGRETAKNLTATVNTHATRHDGFKLPPSGHRLIKNRNAGNAEKGRAIEQRPLVPAFPQQTRKTWPANWRILKDCRPPQLPVTFQFSVLACSVLLALVPTKSKHGSPHTSTKHTARFRDGTRQQGRTANNTD